MDKISEPPKKGPKREGFFPLRSPAGKAEKDQFILNYLPLINHIAYRTRGRVPGQIPIQGLVSAGVIGLMDALNKYDSGKNTQFKTYAEYRIRGAMLDELRSLDLVSRSYRSKYNKLKQICENLAKGREGPVEDEEIAQAMDISLDDYYRILRIIQVVWVPDLETDDYSSYPLNDGDPTGPRSTVQAADPYQLLAVKEFHRVLSETIDELSPKEKKVISLYYYQELTLDEIAKIMGYSESRICQIHGKAIQRLQVKLAKNLPWTPEEKEKNKREVDDRELRG